MTETAEELTALATFSPGVRFVEWKAMFVADTVWAPYFEAGAEPREAYREFDGERWIYVLRRDVGSATSPARLVDELHVVNKKIAATPMKQLDALRKKSKDPNTWPERDKRPQPIPVGERISFAQRLLGRLQWHYFFASRIRLTSEAIKELQNNADRWMEPVSFEPDDLSSFVDVATGERIVPVLDPLTVALHLTSYYEVALDDFANYTRPHKYMPEDKRKRVLKRNIAIMIADIVDRILDGDGTTRKNIDQSELYEFRKKVAEQIHFRARTREIWSQALSDWLNSEPIRVLAKAHQFDIEHELEPFLKIMARCRWRLGESPKGRDQLDKELLNETRFDWIHNFLLAERSDATAVNGQQVVRKLGSAAGEWLIQYAPIAALRELNVEYFKKGLENVLGHELEIDAVMHIRAGKWSGYRTYQWIDRGWNGPGNYYARTIVNLDDVKQFKPDPHMHKEQLKASWTGALRSTMFLLDSINFAFRLAAVGKAFKEGEDRKWAVLEFVSGSIEVGKSALEAFSTRETIMGFAREEFLHALGALYAAIDTVLGVRETVEALSEGDYGKGVGSILVTLGSGSVMVGCILGFFEIAVPWLAIAGFLFVVVGSLVKMLFGHNDSDLDLFLQHCPWGENPFGSKEGDSGKKPEWADANYGAWRDDYPAMMRAFMQLLCKVTVQRNSNTNKILRGRLMFGWIPPGSKVQIRLTEEWATQYDRNKTLALEETVVFTSDFHLKGHKFAIDGVRSNDRAFDVMPSEHAYQEMVAEITKDQRNWRRSSVLRVKLLVNFSDISFEVPREGDFSYPLAP